uniref:Uncharacterized protein n=1 Tax=Arundo donax TaxID=35708 RepID=A0A0A9DXS9_ARUDO
MAHTESLPFLLIYTPAMFRVNRNKKNQHSIIRHKENNIHTTRLQPSRTTEMASSVHACWDVILAHAMMVLCCWPMPTVS